MKYKIKFQVKQKINKNFFDDFLYNGIMV